mgnify:CR=1 FL=1
MTKFKRIQLGVITSAKNTVTKLIKIKEELEGINKMIIDKDIEIKRLNEELERINKMIIDKDIEIKRLKVKNREIKKSKEEE